MVSISPTAARSVVGTSWIAASGRPAARRPATRPAWIARDEWRLSEPPRRIAALPAFRQSAPASAVTFGPALEDHPDHPERRAHPADVQAGRPVPFREHLPDRIGLRGDGAQAVDHAARPAPRSAAAGRASRALRPLARRARHVGGVGGEDAPRGPPRSHRPRPAAPRPSALGGREGQLARRRARALLADLLPSGP